MLRAVFACVVLVVVWPAIAHASDPPPPNAARPVDYLAWVNRTYGEGIRENAAERYRAALEAFVPSDEALRLLDRNPQASWVGDDLLVLTDWVNRNDACLSKLAEAARVERCYFERKSSSRALFDAEFPVLQPLRDVGRLLTTRARLRLVEHNVDDALEDVGTLLRCARHLATQPQMTEFVFALGIAAQAYDVLIELPRWAGEDVDYERVLRSVREFDAATVDRPLKQLEIEKIQAWDVAQRSVRDRDGDGRFDTLDGPRFEGGSGRIDPPATLPVIAARIEESCRLLRSAFDPDYAAARGAARELNSRGALRADPILSRLLPDVTGVALTYRKGRAHRNASRIILNLHAYHAQHGVWPKTLLDALRTEPPAVRTDPFSGADFGYRLRDGEPVVYSVGINGLDDGGRRPANGPAWAPTRDRVFWPPVGS